MVEAIIRVGSSLCIQLKREIQASSGKSVDGETGENCRFRAEILPVLTVLCRRSLGNGGSFEEPVLQTLCPSSGSSHLCLFWLEPEMLNSPRKPIQLKGGTMVRIVIDYDKCAKEKDKICVEICPVSIFRFGKSAKPEAVNVENCIMCRTCQVNCPRQAIEIVF